MKRTYWWNPETKQIEEITRGVAVEWVNTGIRYGRETLDKMKREGLTPMEDWTNTWAAKERERKGLNGQDTPTPEQKSERRRSVAEAMEKVRAGYKPRRIPMLDD